MEIAMYIIWAIIAIVAITIELHTIAQVGWATAIGAIGGIIAHAITKGDPLWVEFVVFGFLWIISWVILFILIKKIRRIIHDKEDGYLNYIGGTYDATKDNSQGYGEITISDKVFRFTSKDKVSTGDTIKVIQIMGVTFIVERIK
ncbi:NfeD family protein [Candidatus Mycoplasma mahonii]|uniref:NfeD family protein n=1 Tax=Candidatus Mycoplasma mahonii TaxID=3004105 RepID=UPI0026F0E5C2|nr:NfeD family protein [Candidatus Mycoplasma mahonii]WKX02230.1 hypothetical protein O3I44_02385 [Candidatus Mycoplasma mahonii]